MYSDSPLLTWRRSACPHVGGLMTHHCRLGGWGGGGQDGRMTSSAPHGGGVHCLMDGDVNTYHESLDTCHW